LDKVKIKPMIDYTQNYYRKMQEHLDRMIGGVIKLSLYLITYNAMKT